VHQQLKVLQLRGQDPFPPCAAAPAASRDQRALCSRKARGGACPTWPFSELVGAVRAGEPSRSAGELGSCAMAGGCGLRQSTEPQRSRKSALAFAMQRLRTRRPAAKLACQRVACSAAPPAQWLLNIACGIPICRPQPAPPALPPGPGSRARAQPVRSRGTALAACLWAGRIGTGQRSRTALLRAARWAPRGPSAGGLLHAQCRDRRSGKGAGVAG
jgi:hypothetical protein